MDLITSFIYKAMSFRLRKIERYSADSDSIQSAQLAQVLRQLNDTAYSSNYSKKPIKSYEEFSRCIPIVEYENLRTFVEEMLKGERGQLFLKSVSGLLHQVVLLVDGANIYLFPILIFESATIEALPIPFGSTSGYTAR